MATVAAQRMFRTTVRNRCVSTHLMEPESVAGKVG